MDESKILDDWIKKLDLDNWWKEILVQSTTSPETFNFDEALGSVPWSEFNASQTIFGKIGFHMSYVEASKTWYAWDGRIHAPCDGEALAYKVSKLYFEAVRRALSEVEAIVEFRAHSMEQLGAEDKDVKKLREIYEKGFFRQRAFRDRLSSDAGLSSLVRMLRSDFDVPRDHYDNDQSFLVVRNCVFDLDAMRTSRDDEGNLNGAIVPMPHDPARPVTKFLDVDFKPAIHFVDSRWWEYLRSSIKDGDMETLLHLQKVTGAAFMGQKKLRTMINLKGPPASGKSVFVETLWKMGKEGAGYCAMPNSSAIAKVQGTNFDQDIFKGKRFIGISEPDSKTDIDDDFLKRYTGDVWVETRTLHAKSTGWAPQGVIFVSSNGTLRINTRDQAIVDRVQVIDFPYEFVHTPDPSKPLEKMRDEGLSDQLGQPDEQSAILNWILLGMRAYVSGDPRWILFGTPGYSEGDLDDYKTGNMTLKAPQSVEANKVSLVSNASSALRWLYEMIEEGEILYEKGRQANSSIKIAEAYSRYTIWCSMNGERRALSKRFFEEDIAHRFPVAKYDNTKCFDGLGYTNNHYAKINSQQYTFGASVPSLAVSEPQF